MILHPEIEVVRRQVDGLVERHLAYLRTKPTPFLEELQQRAEEAMAATNGCENAAAKINHDICEVVLANRKEKVSTVNSVNP